MFAHEFVRNAYLAGTCVALACGCAGWFVILRSQLFASDALSHVAFVGAIAAGVLGLDERIGLFALTLLVGAGMAMLGRRAQADDAAIGIVFAWILGIGLLMLTLQATSSSGGNGVTAVNTLFGSIFDLSAGSARLAAVIAVLVVLAIAGAFRPLLLSTLDPELATIRGLPVRVLGVAFLVILAVVSAEATQAVGALLLLGLLAAPAGAAHRLTTDPRRGVALAGALAVLATWAGLAISYTASSIPPSSAIIGLAALEYAAAAGLSRAAR